MIVAIKLRDSRCPYKGVRLKSQATSKQDILVLYSKEERGFCVHDFRFHFLTRYANNKWLSIIKMIKSCLIKKMYSRISITIAFLPNIPYHSESELTGLENHCVAFF
jgi:hypothetical protein